MLLRAEYRDGFTEHLLRWELIAQAGTVLVRAEWFAHGEPDDTAHSEFRFSLDDQQIQRIFETLDPLEEKYDAGCDDVESSEFCVERDRTIRRQVHGGFQLRRRVCGGFILGGELPGIDAFFSVWDPIQREVESRLQLPWLPPTESIHVGHGIRTTRNGHASRCDIWISYEDGRFPVVLGEGVDAESVACPIAADELLKTPWADMPTICRCEWLVDDIKRLIRVGEFVTAAKLEEAWRERMLFGVH